LVKKNNAPHFIRKTRGKALVLFTSHRMLAEATRRLAPWFRREHLRLLSQAEGVSRSAVLASFRSDRDSVLFGTDSFWQGVDVPGEALANVIITRLPFSRTDHPLLEAQLQAITRRGGDSFREYLIPEAVLKLKQGIGRLIRSKSDHGIVAILDPRTLTKPYGRIFLDSLPDCPRIVETPEPVEE
jgi:ATP-dependent DNA helicase DinG